MGSHLDEKGLEWQIGVWDRISDLYIREIDRRFIPVIETLMNHASLQGGEAVLDLGSGTGSLTLAAASAVAPAGNAVGVDISLEMITAATRRANDSGLHNVEFREGRAEDLPFDDSSFDAVLASLSLMYVIDRNSAAREIARVLKPDGRFVAAVWAAPDECDIVLFQQTAGSFAPAPPVPGVGPGSMADPGAFVDQLTEAGIAAEVVTVELGFDFEDFESAWEALAGVTTAQLAPQIQARAKQAVRDAMWDDPEEPRHFRNRTHFIIGRA